jgi:hypothetical protein
VLRNKNTGQFEVYDIANNQLIGVAPLGAVGLDWQLGGFAADPPDRLHGQLGWLSISARAGNGRVRRRQRRRWKLEHCPLGADTSQQTFLTTPQHA